MTDQQLQELRLAYTRLVLNVDFPANEEVLNMYVSFILKIVHYQADIEVTSYSDGDSRMVAQMMLTKILCLRSMLWGVDFEENGVLQLQSIIDPGVIAALVRNMYETAATFNLMFVHPSTPDERVILYNLWVIAGLKYRQNLAAGVISVENQAKAAEELQDIQTLTNEIVATTLFAALSAQKQDLILNRIKRKDFKLAFENGEPKEQSWADLMDIMGFDKDAFQGMYTYLSLYAHPSRVSVSQFGEMFAGPDQHFLDLTRFNLMYARGIISVFLTDFIRVFPDVLQVFEQLPLINQLSELAKDFRKML